MSAIDVMRDALFGNPPSPTKEPSREGVLAAFTQLYDAAVVAQAAAQAGITILPTTAARDTFYATPANRGKLVYVNNNGGSATDPTNGVYEYVGGSARLAAGFYQGVATVVQPLVDQAVEAAESIAALDDELSTITQIGRQSAPVTGFSASSGTYLFAQPAPRNGRITLVRAFGGASVTQDIRLRRFAKSNSSFEQVGNDVIVSVPSGIASEAVSIPINAGEYVGFYAPSAAFTYTAEAADDGGWYYAASDTSSVQASNPTTTIRLQIGFDLKYYDLGEDQLTDLLRADHTRTTVDGLTVAVSDTVRKNGADVISDATLIFPAPSADRERLDLILADRVTGAITRAAGADRQASLDALEWQPEIPSGKILLARAQVTAATVRVAKAADFRGLVKVGREGEHTAHVERNRAILRRVTGKAARAAPVRLGGYGDSITAFQLINSPADMPLTANGAVRDRPELYFVTYPSDTKALIPTYDFGDGAGQVHIRLGWNWAIKDALDARADSAVTTYLNYGIGGTTSGAEQYNGRHPDRIAPPLADNLDLVVIAFGMNERGSAATYGNIRAIVETFQADGATAVVMGCPRVNSAQSVIDWRYTNDALEAAAMDSGAAYVSTAMIAEDRNLGAIGVPAEVLGSTTIATAGNHPGIFEMRQYGRAAVTQLGL